MAQTMTGTRKSTILSMPLENPLVPGHWSQKPWLRTVMGIIVAQGLFLFLRRCVEANHLYPMAGMLDALEQARTSAGFFVTQSGIIDAEISKIRNLWQDETGFLIWQGLQVAALLLGGILAGAGQKAGWQYGGVIGLINGVISLFQLIPYQPKVDDVHLYGLPFLYIVVGIIASMIGAFIWPPLQIASSEDLRKPAKGAKPPWWKYVLHSLDLRNIKVHWVQCLLCAAIAAAGTFFLKQGYEWATQKMGITDVLAKKVSKEQVITMLTWLWVFLCAMAAGSNTKHGWIQGFFVGVACGPAFLLRIASAEGGPAISGAELPATLGTFLALGVAGGSFGAGLLPPVIKGAARVNTRMTGI
jgi:hypothetical protein